MKAIRWLGALSLCFLAWAPAAMACGHCVEDRIAAVYDHALVKQAAARKQQVAYFAWEGPVARSEAVRAKMLALADNARGVEKRTARVSMEPAAIAVVFDPQKMKPAQVETSLRQQLRALKISLTPLEAARGAP